MSWYFVGAAVVTAISAIAQGDAQRRAAHTNADIARQKARIAVDQATVNEDAQRRRTAIAVGRQAASAAEGSGLDGTNVDLIQQSATDAEIDALNIRYGGQISQVSNVAQAGLSDMAANDANSAGYLNAGAAALSSYGGYRKANPKVGG